MSKIRLFVRKRKHGYVIASVPLKRLVKLAGHDKRRWEFKMNESEEGKPEGGWLILEAF